MKNWMLAITLAIGLGSAGGALAHGAKPKHGGTVATAEDLHFELADRNGKPVIYVEDHGAPYSTAGLSGKMTVLNGANKTEVPLQPAGENVLQGAGSARLAKGTKAVAAILFPGNKVINVRFAVQ